MEIYKKWLLQTLIFVLLISCPFTAVIGFNYWIDPLWLFSHQHPLNDVQEPFDERLLKTHRITFGEDNYNALLLGSSRVTYMNEDEFQSDTYNYAVSSMLVEEYDPYLTYASKQIGKEFDTVYIGLDFWGTNVYRPKENIVDLNEYTQDIRQPLYRIKQLLSFNTFRYAKNNYASSKHDEILFDSFRAYNRENIAYAKLVTPEEKKLFFDDLINEKEKEKYVYDESYKEILLNLKKNHPKSKFVVFLTPVTKERWDIEFKSDKKWEDYKRWVTEVVDVFGECINFMTINSITINGENFYDTQHAYPEIGTLIIRRLSGKDELVPQDFGFKMTQHSLQNQFEEINKFR